MLRGGMARDKLTAASQKLAHAKFADIAQLVRAVASYAKGR